MLKYPKYPTDILCFVAESPDRRFVRLRVVGCTTYQSQGDDDFARMLSITLQAATLSEAFALFGQFWTVLDIEQAIQTGQLKLRKTSWVVPCTLNNSMLKLRVEAEHDEDLLTSYSLLAFDDTYVYAGYVTSSKLPKLPRRVVAGTFAMFVNYTFQCAASWWRSRRALRDASGECPSLLAHTLSRGDHGCWHSAPGDASEFSRPEVLDHDYSCDKDHKPKEN